MAKLTNRTGNFILTCAFFVFACLTFMLLWSSCGDGEDNRSDNTPRTPQECADHYRAMSDTEKSWWKDSEDFINSCSP